MSEGGSRLSRWSRLKSEARQQSRLRFAVPEEEKAIVTSDEAMADAEPADRGSEPDPSATPEGEPLQAGAEDAETLDLPDIETLDASSDYTPFMSDKVSDAVRNMALRKLWRSDSVFANLDGMIDYGEDFTDAARVVGGMKSVYTVGRGMVDYEAEEAKKLAAESEVEETEAGGLELAEDGSEGDLEEAGAETATEAGRADEDGAPRAANGSDSYSENNPSTIGHNEENEEPDKGGLTEGRQAVV